MDIGRTIIQIAILWVYFFVGTLIVQWLDLIIPGSIIGLLLLLLSLHFKLLDVKMVQFGATFLLSYLTLFFIPATVAIVNYPEMLTSVGVLLVSGVIFSTIFVLVVTGKVAQWIERVESRGETDDYIS